MKHMLYPLLAFLLSFGILFGVNTSQIASLHDRTQTSTQSLTDRDKDIISDFWRNGLDELLLSDTSQDVIAVRKELVRYRGAEKLSNYAAAYIAEGIKDLQIAFENVTRLEDPDQRTLIRRNLMILAAELEHPNLSEIALERLDDDDPVVRYWAVKSITQSSIIQALSSDLNKDQVINTILTGLSKRVSVETQPEVLEMICGFCMAVNAPDAQQILLSLCDRRIEAYQAWQGVQTGLDIRLLKASGSIAAVDQSAEVKTTFAQKFATFYAFTVQRLMKGGDALSDSEKNDIRTVIAEIDQTVVLKTMEIRTGILQALKTNNMNALKREYEILFGDRLRQGELAKRYKFDYGKSNAGKAVTCPTELKPMPKPPVQE